MTEQANRTAKTPRTRREDNKESSRSSHGSVCLGGAQATEHLRGELPIDLSIELCGVRLRNPLVLASGVWGCCVGTLVRLARAGAGAVTAKSCSLEPRKGHPNPTVLDWGAGLINAIGLANPGATEEREVLRRAKSELAPLGVPLIASIFGNSQDEFRRAAQIIAEAEPDFLELNISCPNVEAEFGQPFALDPIAAAGVTAAVRAVYPGRLLVKLSPNAPNIVAVALAVADAGADGLTAVNTLGPGMIIDVRAGRPVLANRAGGVSGAALRPIAVRCVYDLAASGDLPIIGTGGVLSGEDAMQMLMAGATAVGIGSALYYQGDAAFANILSELETLMREEGYTNIAQFRGSALESNREGAKDAKKDADNSPLTRGARGVTEEPAHTHRTYRVVANRREGANAFTLILDGDLPAQPGQFVMAWLPGLEERPFSIMDDAPLSLTIAEIGPFTRALGALRPGDRLWIRGPFGRGFELVGQRHLLIGGGSGVAGLTLLAKRALAVGCELRFALGARTASQLMLRERVEALGIPVIVATDDGSAGYQGTVLDAVAGLLDSHWPESVYGCGPEPMLRALAARTEQLGLPAWVSLERTMRCGIGICGNCHIGDQLVCRDGPVFPASRLREIPTHS